MRLPFATICLAIAAFRACVGSYAAPSHSIPQPPRSLLGVATKRHLRSDKLEIDDEERVDLDIIRNKLPGEEEIVGETSKSLMSELEQQNMEHSLEFIRNKLLGEEEIVGETSKSSVLETEHLNLMKELEQLVKPVASEEEKNMEQSTLLYDWKQMSSAFEDELNNAQDEKLKKLLGDKRWIKKRPMDSKKVNGNKLLEGWTVPDEPIESESKSSTENLQAWLEKKQSVNNDKLPYELFKVLGIHKAVDEAANGLLIRMNLERWNFVMKSLLKTKEEEYKFENKLVETLEAYCGDNNRAQLFIDRLIILNRGSTRHQLSWLRDEIEPEFTYGQMVTYRNGIPELEDWLRYVASFNDLYPNSKKKTMFAATGQSEDFWIENNFVNQNYPNKHALRLRILEDLYKSWAESDPPLSPARVLIRLKYPPDGKKLTHMQKKIVKDYLIVFNAGKQPHEQLTEELVKNSLKDKKELEEHLREEKKTINDHAENKRIDECLKSLVTEKTSKRKAESPPEDAREGRRPRGD